MLKSISRISVRYVFRATLQPNSVISWHLCGLICHPHQVFLRLIALTSCHTWRSCRNAQTWSWVRFRYIGLTWIWHMPYITCDTLKSGLRILGIFMWRLIRKISNYPYFTKLAEMPLWCKFFHNLIFQGMKLELNNWYSISFHFWNHTF